MLSEFPVFKKKLLSSGIVKTAGINQHHSKKKIKCDKSFSHRKNKSHA